MEPEPMPDHIVQQDIMLDDIKEYRKIISELMYHLHNNYDNSDECKTIYNEYNFLSICSSVNVISLSDNLEMTSRSCLISLSVKVIFFVFIFLFLVNMQQIYIK